MQGLNMTMFPVHCNQRLRCHIRPIHPVHSQNSLHMSCMLHRERMDICSINGACVGLGVYNGWPLT